MTINGTRPTERLPRGVLCSVAVGMSSASAAWLLSGTLSLLTVSYPRLDQLTALLFGAVIGGSVLGAHEYRQRRRVISGAAIGGALGGCGAVIGVSMLAFSRSQVGPGAFLAERALTWALVAAGMSVPLVALIAERRTRWIVEGATLAAVGGAIAGVIFTLPGASDVWQAIAILWLGSAVGLAVAGPELWHAIAVVEMMPARDRGWNPLRMREWPLHDGVAIALGEAQLACQRGQVALYPPAGGVVAAGHTVRTAAFVTNTGMIAVGRTRYRVQVLRTP